MATTKRLTAKTVALPGPGGSGAPEPLPYAGAALATLALTVLHYRRFSVPITVAAGAAALPGALLALAFALVPDLGGRALSAILVAGLTYAGIAFGALIRDAGFAGRAAPLSFLALGAFVLLLSAGWHALRGLALSGLPAGLAARLPHPIGAR